MSLLVRAYAFVTRKPLVWLSDADGTVTLSYARPNPFGGISAPRFPFYNTRECLLGPDGAVIGGAYVTRWKYEKATGAQP